MAKLTEKQADILRRMASGDALKNSDNIFNLGHPGYWYIGGKRTDGRTAKALEARGYIKGSRKDWNDHATTYTLTDVGRAALAATDANAKTDEQPTYVLLIDDFTTVRVYAELRTREALLPAVKDVVALTNAIKVTFADQLTDLQRGYMGALFRYPGIVVSFNGRVMKLCKEYPAELEPAQPEHDDDAVTIADIQANLDSIEWHDSANDARMLPHVEQLSDGIGCEWLYVDGGFADYEMLGKTLEEALSKSIEMTAPFAEEQPDPCDAEIDRLRRELEAVTRERDALSAALGTDDKWWNTNPAEFARMFEPLAGEYANYRAELEEDEATVFFTLAEWLASELSEQRNQAPAAHVTVADDGAGTA